MAFWRRFREWVVGILFLALLLGTIGAPSTQVYYAEQNFKFLQSNRMLRSPPLGDSIWISERFSVVGVSTLTTVFVKSYSMQL